MAMTRRSWFRAVGAIGVLGLVVAGGAFLWSQTQPTAVPVGTIPATKANWARPDLDPNYKESLKPLGTWERKVGPLAVTLRFDAEQMHGTVHIKIKDGDPKECTVNFRADYSVTKDSILYGVVSMADIKLGTKKMDGEELGRVLEGVAALQEQPFSMRFRVDGDELVLRNLKFHVQTKGEDAQDGSKLNLGLGRFTRKVEGPVVTDKK